jgi:hypothetical protein
MESIGSHFHFGEIVMCSFSEFYYRSPDGAKVLILILPWLALVASVWLWTRRRPVVHIVPMTEAQLRAVARDVAMLLRGNCGTIKETDDTNCRQRLNPPKGREEED